MAIAIHTKYINPTATRGACVRASVNRGGKTVSLIVPYNHGGDAHLTAAQAMRDLHWPGEALLLAGCALDGNGDVYTIFPRAA